MPSVLCTPASLGYSMEPGTEKVLKTFCEMDEWKDGRARPSWPSSLFQGSRSWNFKSQNTAWGLVRSYWCIHTSGLADLQKEKLI